MTVLDEILLAFRLVLISCPLILEKPRDGLYICPLLKFLMLFVNAVTEIDDREEKKISTITINENTRKDQNFLGQSCICYSEVYLTV